MILSPRGRKGRLTAVVLFAGAVLCALILAAGWLHGRNAVRLPDEIARQTYIRSLGYTPDGNAGHMDTVVIPQWFDTSYAQYNARQKQAGFDLSPWRGCEVRRYTYQLRDFPAQDPVLLHLLVWEDRLIGGDICSTAAGGFLYGLKAAGT